MLDDAELAMLFPAYIRLDLNGRVTAAGPSILEHAGANLIGSTFFSHFGVERPARIDGVDALRSHGRPLIVRT